MSNWYTVELEDKGAGRNGQVFYIEADSKREVEDRIPEIASNDMSVDPVRIDLVSNDDPESMGKSVLRGRINVAYRQDGTQIRKSDIHSSDFGEQFR